MKTLPQIFAWLNAVKFDHDLPASCFKVAFQMALKTNGAEFKKSGQLVTWQSEPTMAAAIQMSERTVRDMVSRLQAAGYLEIKTGRGRGHSNRYTLTIPQNRQRTAGFTEPKTGSGLPQLDRQNRQSDVLKPAVQRIKTGSRLPPNLSIRELSNLCPEPNRETELGGPRQRADALGPLDEALRRKIDPDNFKAWLSKASFVSLADGTITLSAPTRFIAEQIANRFERQILESAPGATRLKVVVQQAAEPTARAAQ